VNNRSEIHAVYVALHRHRQAFSNMKMINIVTCLFGRETWSWQVIGISPSALALFREAGWKRPTVNRIQRAHLIPRAEMVRHIMNRDEPMIEEALFDYWIAADRTVIVAPGENKKVVPDYIAFDNPDCNLFPCADGVGFVYRPNVEGVFLAAKSTSVNLAKGGHP